MALEWIHEDGPAHWDAEKRRVLGGVAVGVFDYSGYSEGDLVPGDWWRVEEDGKTLGYGWMDVVWGDAEILLAVDSAARQRGVGTFILDQLERQARLQGLNYLFNVVPPEHPDVAGVTAWLSKRGFAPSQDDRLSRRVVAKQHAE